MTGDIRYGLGLIVVALLAGLAGLLLRATNVGEMLLLAAIVLAGVGLFRLASGLLHQPQRD